jgi:transcriptional regulator with XRE-family HTH domain
MSHALELCFAQRAAGKTRQQIALDIGYSRPAVSRYLSGTYGESVAGVEAAILKAYDRRDCPHTGESVDPALCHKKALGPKPFGGTSRLAWWTSCQTCPHKPESEGAAK